MVGVLVILDGAAQPAGAGLSTSLAAARTPHLDRLAAAGAVRRLAATPPGLAPGSEVGIPTLLGCPPRAPVGRGRVEAAARGIEVPPGFVPWRVDVRRPGGRRACEREARAVGRRLGAGARPIGGHRLLLLSRERPAERSVLGLELTVWADGPPPGGRVPAPTTLVCARGAASGCGRLVGASVVIPAGATGDVDTDLAAKSRAALAAIAAGAPRVVVHVGAPDEAAHRGEPDAVVEVLERVDGELLWPLSEAVGAAGGRLAVCSDHGTDPGSGRHIAEPVPALRWGAGVAPSGPSAMQESLVEAAEVVDPGWLLS